MTEMMDIGEEPFRTWLIPLISFIPISPCPRRVALPIHRKALVVCSLAR